MALNISKVCSADSFLLTFRPLQGSIRDPFYILLDPVLEEPATNSLVLHPQPSRQSQSIPSIRRIPTPDLVIISQSRISPPLEAALRHIALTATKTIILASPAAAKTLRSWKNFDFSIVRTLSPWQDPRRAGQDRVARMPVPPCYAGGEHGEVTVSLVPQKGCAKSARAAMGITYRPSAARPSPFRRSVTNPVTIPTSIFSTRPLPPLPSLAAPAMGALSARLVPPTPPHTPKPAQLPQKDQDAVLPAPRVHGQTLSVIFSPRGTSYNSLKPYATSHLVSEAALPLTALVHSFDTEPRPWWALGRNSSHLPIGQETALALGARVWVATCGWDNKAIAGGKRPRARTYLGHEVQEMLDRAEAREKRAPSGRYAPRSTQTLDLDQGEEVTLTSDGICELGPPLQHQSAVPDALGLFNNVSVFED